MTTLQFFVRCRFRQHVTVCFLGLCLLQSTSGAKSQSRPWSRSDREALAGRHGQRSQEQRQQAWSTAERQGWRSYGTQKERSFELQAVQGGLVFMKAGRNVAAAILTGTDLIRDPASLGLRGLGQSVGIWDVGAVRATHREFGDRVIAMDSPYIDDHSTHVCGTLAATGIESEAMGMAPEAYVHSYDSFNDLAEATLNAMSAPEELDMLQLSNHAYGWICGWDDYTSPPRWYGRWGLSECELFGQYDLEAQAWDDLCSRAPFYLPVRAVGNDRDNRAPEPGALFQYYTEAQGWEIKAYDPDADPGDDGEALGGYDTICADACAKNMLSIGAVGIKRGQDESANLSDSIISMRFSGWGPTDDGRIKPDLVANGARVYSTTASGDSSYESMSGTSMACAVACGSAVLICELYDMLFPGQVMRSSTLKGLLIHTAEDLGTPGPDYQNGWGLLRVDQAAQHLQDYSLSPAGLALIEDELDEVTSARSYTFSAYTNSTLHVTLCWTDPPASVKTGLNDPAPCLVHDLDLRLVDPRGTLHEPYILNPNEPYLPAHAGDNTRDNVEQITLVTALTGVHSIQVTCKTPLSVDGQRYSLLATVGE